jgi:cytochrome P450
VDTPVQELQPQRPSLRIPRRYRRLTAPPGPPRSSALRQMRRITKEGPLALVKDLVDNYGYISRVTIGPVWFYYVQEPELIQKVLVTDHRKFIKGVGLQRAKLILGEGLLTSEGRFHRRQRRLVQPAFHREQLQAYGETMAECARQMRDRWEDGAEVDMAAEMMRVTLAIVGRTLFSADVEGEAEEIGVALKTIMSFFDRIASPWGEFLNRLPLPSTLRLQRALARIDQTILRMVNERRATGEDAGDLLSMLLMANTEEDGRMSDQQIRDEAITLFLAGHETTANALAWTWYLLAQSPEAEAKLHAELDTVLAGRAPGPADLAALPYTRKVFKESMRLYPPAYIVGRQALEDYQLGPYIAPRGSMVIVSQYLIQRDPRFYPDPDIFQPDRWTPEFEATLPKFAYFPFGGGPRMCIGKGFANMEGPLLLATLAQHWRASLVPGQDIALQPMITLRPKHGIRMLLHRR